MQTMIRINRLWFPCYFNHVGNEGCIRPELKEDTILNQVTLNLMTIASNQEKMRDNENFAQKMK